AEFLGLHEFEACPEHGGILGADGADQDITAVAEADLLVPRRKAVSGDHVPDAVTVEVKPASTSPAGGRAAIAFRRLPGGDLRAGCAASAGARLRRARPGPRPGGSAPASAPRRTATAGCPPTGRCRSSAAASRPGAPSARPTARISPAGRRRGAGTAPACGGA